MSGAHFLYAAEFAAGVKVGVTIDPARRIGQLRRSRSEAPARIFTLQLPEREARERERVIARLFGEATRVKGRASEWLPGADFEAVVAEANRTLPPRDKPYHRSRRLLKAVAAARLSERAAA